MGLGRDLAYRASELDPGGTASDHDEGQQRTARRGVLLQLCRLKCGEQPTTNLERLIDGLEPWRMRLPVGVTKVGMRRPRGEDEVVIGGLPDRSADDMAIQVQRSTAPMTTRTLSCRRKMRLIGAAMSAGDNAAEAT